jgi:3-isopropylmalate/(R)-2-methylmalate dehydratase small subunit
MQGFTTVTGTAAPLLLNDVNTDQIAPGVYLRHFRPDYAALLFGLRRYRPDGSDDPGFVLNRPQYRQARILVTGENFGCGSSREQAVWAMTAFGIGCVVARSFADIYRENCLKNGLLPVVLGDTMPAFEALVEAVDGNAAFTVSLEERHILAPDGTRFEFAIGDGERHALIHGLDDIGLTLERADTIAAWEAQTRANAPWLQTIPGL